MALLFYARGRSGRTEDAFYEEDVVEVENELKPIDDDDDMPAPVLAQDDDDDDLELLEELEDL